LLPCRGDTPEHAEAGAKLAALRKRAKALAADDDPTPANRELTELLAHPCWSFAAFDRDGELVADSALAMKDWWERGGGMWLDHYLGLWDLGAEHRYGVVAPAMGKTLSAETHRDHPLASLLCPLDDAGCGRSTRGWAMRAEHAFDTFAIVKRAQSASSEPPESRQSCEAKAAAAPADSRYETWIQCVKTTATRVASLRLVGLKEPTKGWLVLRGRRGHHSFCDEIRAYDLATGAAYLAQSCSGLVLRRGGSVDGQATDAARRPAIKAGRMPLAQLREAAWMALSAEDALEPSVRSGFGLALPRDMLAKRSGAMSFSGGGSSWSSGHTVLAWSYQDHARFVHAGKLSWPDDPNHAPRDHAVKLLQIAEEGFIEGCAPARLPKLAEGKTRPGVSAIDASRESLRKANDAMRAALEELRSKTRLCP
jgi:hypothetical protein